MSFTMKEILKNKKFEDQSPEVQKNLLELLQKINLVRVAYGKSMTATNTLRTMAEHLEIYRKKGITDKSKIPLKSKHLYGFAIDIADADGSFHTWCKAHEKELVEIGIWLENRKGGWQHLQIRPFASYKVGGTIWFEP